MSALIKESKGYAVVRLSMCGKSSRMVMDFRKGVLWYEKFAGTPKVVKEEVIKWLQQLIEMAILICIASEEKDRFLFNPYGVIVGEDGNLYLLDMEDEKNEICRQRAIRRKVREKFDCFGEREQQIMFAAGRMVQSMMAQSDIYPPMNSREKHCVKKIVRLCMKTDQVEKKNKSIRRQIAMLDRKGKHISVAMYVVFGIVLSIGVIGWYAGTVWRAGGKAVKDQKSGENIVGKTLDSMYLEQGKKYFLELEDYEEGKRCFQRIESELAETYIVMAEYMEEQADEEEVRVAIENLEIQDKGDILCLLRVYEKLGDEEDTDRMIDLAKQCLIYTYKKDVYFNEEREFDVKILLARMYEENGQKEEADICYEQIEQGNLTEEQQEKFYIQWTTALMMRKDWTQADKICAEGIEKVPESDELKCIRIQTMCKLPDSRERLVGVLSAYVAQNPNLTKDEEIKRIVAEQKLKMEGGKVWAEN